MTKQIYNSTLDRTVEVPDSSVPCWEAVGWEEKESNTSTSQAPGRTSESDPQPVNQPTVQPEVSPEAQVTPPAEENAAPAT